MDENGADAGGDEEKKGRYTFARAAREEPDAEWRALFQRVERLRKDRKSVKNRPIVFSRIDKEGQEQTIARRQSAPTLLRRILKRDDRKSGRAPALDLELIIAAWNQASGDDIAPFSSLYSFRNGVLSISIHNSALLQEIRQFRQGEIVSRLRSIWPLDVPLIKVAYRQGKK